MIRCIRPRLVTFDVTGTLLMTKLEHYVEIGRQYDLEVDPLQLTRSFKDTFARLTTEHPIYGRHTGLGWKNWWRTIVHKVFEDQHPSVSKDTLNKLTDNLISCYGTAQCWNTYPGAIELLDFLHRKNVVLGVISNFDTRLESILEDTKILKYFTFVLTSYNFGVEKPSLQIFNEALRSVKCLRSEVISSHEATHIGDRVDNDYFGAKKAGWNALLIKHNKEVAQIEVPEEDVFRDLKEIRRYFEKVFDTNSVIS